jgi:hypothetical protein
MIRIRKIKTSIRTTDSGRVVEGKSYDRTENITQATWVTRARIRVSPLNSLNWNICQGVKVQGPFAVRDIITRSRYRRPKPILLYVRDSVIGKVEVF